MNDYLAKSRLWFLNSVSTRAAIATISAAITLLGILLVNPQSIAQFVWFFCAWSAFIFVFDRPELERFALAFLINSSFIAIYVLIQTQTYPDSYGMTSYSSVSWTDDSYFFSLAADSIPADLLTRPYYWLYSHSFTSLIRAVTPLPIEHPLDALFFQSGTAALLCTYTSQLMLQLSGNRRLADNVFTFVLICPFLMMNGGVVLIRDTFAAALLVYSLVCINRRRYAGAILAVSLQIALRPGTGLLLLPAYFVIYFREIADFVRRHPIVVAVSSVVLVLVATKLGPLVLDRYTEGYGLPKVGFLGRELIADLTADPDANALFLRIQEAPIGMRIVLNAAYIFLYPFLTLRTLFAAETFDVRNFALSFGIPVYAFWLNAWFFAGALTRVKVMEKQREIVIAIAMTLMLVGIYSLQTRHKTIIYPMYYMIVAIGFAYASPLARRFGYVISGSLMLVQVASAVR